MACPKVAPPPPQDEGELGQLAKMDSEMTEAVREIRQKVDEAKSSLSSNRSRGRVLDALMQQKKHGKIAGIYGRLVQLHEHIVIPFNVKSGGPQWGSSV